MKWNFYKINQQKPHRVIANYYDLPLLNSAEKTNRYHVTRRPRASLSSGQDKKSHLNNTFEILSDLNIIYIEVFKIRLLLSTSVLPDQLNTT